jgi:Flp pilus assembly protein TadG
MVKRNLLHNDGGSAFVELALVVPLLCLVLIGSVELGRMAYAAIEVSNAARAAVAYGSQNRTTAKDDDGYMKTVAAADAANLASLGATLHTNTSQACVCDTGSSMVSFSDCTSIDQFCCPPTEMTGSCTTAGTVVDYVQASTYATVDTLFHYPGIPASFTLHGFAQMRVLN